MLTIDGAISAALFHDFFFMEKKKYVTWSLKLSLLSLHM